MKKLRVEYYLDMCAIAYGDNVIRVDAPDRLCAIGLWRSEDVIQWLIAQGKSCVQIYWPSCNGLPFEIYDWFLSLLGGENDNEYLQNADYRRVMEFMLEKREEGKIVILTSQVDDRCIHTNDRLLPERAYWKPCQFDGYDYKRSWRTQNGKLSNEYHKLRSLLSTDGYIPEYNYQLIRPDGALCEYQSDYYHVEDYCGQPIRIGVSDPNAYRILVPVA